MTITLPWPPSVNKYWVPIKHSHKKRITQAGLDFRVAVRVRILQARVEKLSGRLKVDVFAHPPDRRTRDLDNLWKALLDALAKGGAYDDDGQIDDERMRRREIVKGGKLIVTVEEIPGDANAPLFEENTDG